MKCFTLIGVAILTASCSAKVVEPPKNCAFPPGRFWSFNAKQLREDKTMYIVPPGINSIHVLRYIETEILMHSRTAATWNGSPIDMQTLNTYLDAVADMIPQPYTNLIFEKGVPCHRLLAIRQAMEKRLKCSQNNKCLQGYRP